MNNITAIIPVRKENGELYNKNLLEFGDSNLLVHKIRQLKALPELSRIIVTSECKEMLEMAKGEGVIALERPIEYALHGVSFGKFVEYICSQIEGTHILWTCVTSPLVEKELYKKAIRLYLEKIQEGYDSLISVKLQKQFMLDKNGALNYRKGLKHRSSENLPELYILTNGIALARREDMIKWKYNWGHIPFRMLIDKRSGVDISDRYDYEFARILYENKF